MVLVDSNVLLDIVTGDPDWRSWSETALADALLTGAVVINPLVYAELSIAYRQVEELDAVLDRLRIQRADLPWEAAHRAGQAFLKYRRAAGSKSSPLSDFYIGAHAEASGVSLLTRDARRYRTYFLTVSLITPR